MQFNQVTIRCELFPDRIGEKFVTIATGSTPKGYKGAQMRFEVALFRSERIDDAQDAVLYDIGNVSGLPRLRVRATNASGNVILDSDSGGCEVVKDESLSLETWRDGSKQHFAFSFPEADTGIAVGTHHVVVSGADGDVFGISTFEVIDPGTAAAASPAPGDETYFTKVEVNSKLAGLAKRIGAAGESLALTSADGKWRIWLTAVNDEQGLRLDQQQEEIAG
jgi:hypothetical protein